MQNPYSKKPRLSTSDELDENELAFHKCLKPTFSNNGTLVYQVSGSAREIGQPFQPALQPLVGEHDEVRFARSAPNTDLNSDTLSTQKRATKIVTMEGFPRAHTDSAWIDMARLASESQQAEQAIWTLTSILFEAAKISCAELVGGMTDDQIREYEPQLRKDALSAFFAELVTPFVEDQVAAAKSAEVKALALLTKNDIVGAAEILAKGKNFHLATLVSQLPGTTDTRNLMKNQIEAWRGRNDWSEMSAAVRTLYTLLAGETCVVSGKTGPKEDRVEEFAIAEKFGLNWMQSLSLRVNFGGFSSLAQAVKDYANDLSDGRETTLPVPYWAHGAETLAVGREDTLLSLLRLASTTRAYPADLEALFDPKTVSGSSLNSRLAWQLATILYAKGWADYFDTEKLDQLTCDYASQLEQDGKIVSATWTLLHLTNPKAREVFVRGLLMRNGGSIPDPLPADGEAIANEPDTWSFLAVENKVPEQLLWESKALHARADKKNPVLQTQYLIAAELYEEAHEVLVSTIGPFAVIEEEYDDLIDLVARFPDPKPSGWAVGGRVYQDFSKLVCMNLNRKKAADGRACMERLSLGLEAMGNADGSIKMSLEQRVALVEMSRVLKEEARLSEIDGGGPFDDADKMDGILGGGNGLWERYQQGMGIVA